jgi:hypothetical protein
MARFVVVSLACIASVRHVFLLISLFLVTVPFSNAQDLAGLEQGIKPYGSYEGGDIDSISLVNGSLTLHVPLISTFTSVPATTATSTRS